MFATNFISSLLSCSSLQLETYHPKRDSIIQLTKAPVQGVDVLPLGKPWPQASALSLARSVDAPSSHGVSQGCIACMFISSTTALAPRSTNYNFTIPNEKER